MENSEWKEIPGTAGRLLVSSSGEVLSLLRNRRVLKSGEDNKGYLRVCVTLDRKKASFRVHRLVAEAFIPNLDGKPEVNHKDGNKQNNIASNLEWCNSKENTAHAMRNGLQNNSIKALRSHNEKKRKPIWAREINGNGRLYFSSISEAERQLKTKHICAVLKGQRSQAAGYAFRYE